MHWESTDPYRRLLKRCFPYIIKNYMRRSQFTLTLSRICSTFIVCISLKLVNILSISSSSSSLLASSKSSYSSLRYNLYAYEIIMTLLIIDRVENVTVSTRQNVRTFPPMCHLQHLITEQNYPT